MMCVLCSVLTRVCHVSCVCVMWHVTCVCHALWCVMCVTRHGVWCVGCEECLSCESCSVVCLSWSVCLCVSVSVSCHACVSVYGGCVFEVCPAVCVSVVWCLWVRLETTELQLHHSTLS